MALSQRLTRSWQADRAHGRAMVSEGHRHLLLGRQGRFAVGDRELLLALGLGEEPFHIIKGPVEIGSSNDLVIIGVNYLILKMIMRVPEPSTALVHIESKPPRPAPQAILSDFILCLHSPCPYARSYSINYTTWCTGWQWEGDTSSCLITHPCWRAPHSPRAVFPSAWGQAAGIQRRSAIVNPL
jgi:hypothetical protein